MTHLHWTQYGHRPDAGLLRQKLERFGGAVVQYQIVFSAVLFARTTLHWEWVPPSRSRSRASLKYVAWSVLLGWWSLPGLVLTPGTIVNNLLGGADVTQLI